MKRLADRSMRGMIREHIGDTTVRFRLASDNDYKKTTVYSKHHEVMRNGSPANIEAARGRIRLEHSIRTREISSIVKHLHLPNRAAATILTAEFAHFAVSKVESQLAYDCLFNEDNVSPEEMVLMSLNAKRGSQVIGFARVYTLLGKNFYKLPGSGISSTGYYDLLKEAKQFGLVR
jgi:hypothetical protein